MNEFNPNHPVTIKMRDQWHKIAAIMLFKSGKDTMTITMGDLEAWEILYPGGAIVIEDKKEGLVLRIVDERKAEEIVRKEGGLPL